MERAIEVTEVTITVETAALLSSLWYSDGSGANCLGVPFSCPSTDFEVVDIQLDGTLTHLRLKSLEVTP